MDPSLSFQDLRRRLEAGEPNAAADIVRRFAQRLTALASSRLAANLRRKVDPEDLVQSAFKSFFRAQAGDAVDLADWNTLWSLLATITLRKIGYQVRHFLTAKRNVRREEPPPGNDDSSFEALAREPTPEEAALFSETAALLLESLEPRTRQIVELSLQGLTHEEIADTVGLTERSVYRQLERVRLRLEEGCAEPPPS